MKEMSLRRILILQAALLLGGACGPRVDSNSPLVFADDEQFGSPAPAIESVEFERTRIGTISRHTLDLELEKGVGNFLGSLQVEAVSEGRRFLAWEILSYDNDWLDLIPGDTVSSVNGQRIETPDQVQKLWTSLQSTDAIVVSASRNGVPFELRIDVAGTANDAVN